MAYGYSRSVTIDHTKVPNTDQSNFAVLVKLDSSNVSTTLKSAANGGHVQSSSGYDIEFFSDSGGTTHLESEIDSYDPVNGVVWAWVRVPSLSHTADTVIYVFYGDASKIAFPNAASAVWNDGGSNYYKGVYHGGDGTTLSVASSSGANNGTNNGATAGSGKIGGALSFAGAQSVNLNHPSDWDMGAGDYSYELWVNSSSVSGEHQLLSKDQATGRESILELYAANVRIALLPSNSTYIIRDATTTNLTTGNWFHVVAQRHGNAFETWVNGVSQAEFDPSSTAGFPNTMQATTTDLYLGQRLYSGYEGYLSGLLDEVRIAKGIARSADWVSTAYANQNAPLTFSTIGSETVLSGPSFIPAWTGANRTIQCF